MLRLLSTKNRFTIFNIQKTRSISTINPIPIPKPSSHEVQRHFSKTKSQKSHFSQTKSPKPHFSQISPTEADKHEFSDSEIRVFYWYTEHFQENVARAVSWTFARAKKKGILNPKLYVTVYTDAKNHRLVQTQVNGILKQKPSYIKRINVSPPPEKKGKELVANMMLRSVEKLRSQIEESAIKPKCFFIMSDKGNKRKGMIEKLGESSVNTYLLLKGTSSEHRELIKHSHHYWMWGGSLEGVAKTWEGNNLGWDPKSGIWK